MELIAELIALTIALILTLAKLILHLLPLITIILIICYFINKRNLKNSVTKSQQNTAQPIAEPQQNTSQTITDKKHYLNYEYKKSESSNTYIDIYKNKRKNSAELKQIENPLLKKYLMTKSERIVFDKIKNNLSNKYVIFPQICMRSILSNKFMDRKNKSKWAIVDYLICTYPYYEPVLIIELDDPTHNKHDRRLRDIQLNNLLKRIDLPIWRLRNIEDYSRFDTDISVQIDEMLKEYKINKTTIGY